MAPDEEFKCATNVIVRNQTAAGPPSHLPNCNELKAETRVYLRHDFFGGGYKDILKLLDWHGNIADFTEWCENVWGRSALRW